MALVGGVRRPRLCNACVEHGSRALHNAQLPRSIIFQPPYMEEGPGPQTLSFRARRRAKLRQELKTSQSPNEKAAKADALRDPWWVMANSPMRRCIVSREGIPSDFMIHLRPAWQPAQTSEEEDGRVPQDRLYLLPNRVEHPRHLRTKRSKGWWVSCHKDVISQLSLPGPHTGLLRLIPGLRAPERLSEMIRHQLQLRVVQEMELFEARLRSLPRVQRAQADPLQPLLVDDLAQPLLEAGSTAILGLQRSPLSTADIGLEPHWPTQRRQDDDVDIPIYPGSVFSDHDAMRRVAAKLLRQEESDLPAFVALSSVGPYGHLGVPVAIALSRLRLFHGWGWDPRPEAPLTAQDVVQ